MIRGFEYIPGIPAAGHITTGGSWHPGGLDTCPPCTRVTASYTRTRGANLVSTTITIGWTKSNRDADYVSFADGWRPEAEQHIISVDVDLPPNWRPQDVAEAVFIATNAPELEPGPELRIREAIQATGYRGAEAHWSLSVGDTVGVGGTELACQPAGWQPTERKV